MRLTGERSGAKMAAPSDLLDDVFFNTKVDEKVVNDVVGSLESELTRERRVNAEASVQVTSNHAGNSAVGRNSDVEGSKMGLSQQERAKSGAGVQGGVISSAGSRGPSADAAAETTSSVTAAHSPSKPGTLNGSAVVMTCHITGNNNNNNHSSSSSQPAATLVSNGPVSVSKGSATVPSAIIKTSPATVPTVTLARPPLQTDDAALTSPAVGVNKLEPAKGAMQSAARSPSVLQSPRTPVAPPGGIRAIAPQVFAPRLAQPQQGAPNIQNIQLPPGMVLVRSESGQLLVIHQQTLAQMQAQSQSQSAMTPRPAAPTSTPPVQIASLQAPGASPLARPVAPTTIIKQGSAVQATATPTTTLQRPPVLQNTIVLGGTAPGQPLATPTPVQPAPASAQRATGTPVTPTAVTAETLENVKKCRNFLSTLIKLASSGKQSSETTANVKELVKNLLEAKIEPEDFTSRLYRELSSSPQPYLVPFLKRSLPALRQMTPDPESFIQQSLLPLPGPHPAAATSAALTAVMLRPAPPTASTGPTATKTTVVSLTQTPTSKPALMVAQQHGTLVRPQVTLARSPMATLRGQPHSRIIVSHPQVVKQQPTAMKQTLALGAKGVQVVSQSSLIAAQRNKLKEAAGGTFREDDDINDVASMAGVNLSEESDRILATNSELVGAVTRSCKDEAFLSTPLLARRALEIGRKFGVGELGTDAANFISHATQQRLRHLLERVSLAAQQRNAAFKEDEQCEQVNDARAQLRFFEQLDQMEKQRKEDQEREILLKAAKSRSRQEDPEQLRLKQKAKEMQQQELAQIRQREANLTALAAIGPRKKRKMESPVRGAGAEGSGPGPCQPGGSRQFGRQRITRVNLRDLLFCLENERGTRRSHLLYKGFLK
ncbi:transcription initiation factor TFIID subunit 4-like [Pungitius pungitius]|uniref:transcription initiation factor TFIID subunit 4-like n=1 Tax=Pungitius pungitius TaxID=134920 RepID=UPI002E105A53